MQITGRRGCRGALAIVLLLAILRIGTAQAVMVATGVLGGFENDGNLVASTANDWSNVTPINTPDDTADSGFTAGSKELKPSTWDCANGGANPNKGNILRTYIDSTVDASGIFLNLAWVREGVSGGGDVHLNFEFNQDGTPAFDDPFAVGPCSINRQDGDLLVTYDFPGGNSAPDIDLYQWDPHTVPNSNEDGIWVDQNLPASAARGAVNQVEVSDPLDGTIDVQRFGEATIDLVAVLPSGDDATCRRFGGANVRSRSSGESWTSSLQDILPTTPVDLSTCGGVKVHKVDDDEPAGPLAGARFGLFDDGNPPAEVGHCTTGANGSCTIDDVAPGTYTLKETDAPAGYVLDPRTEEVVIESRETVEIEVPWVDPLKTGSVRVLKKLVGPDGLAIVPDQASDLDGAAFVLYKDANDNETFDQGEGATLWPSGDPATCTISGGDGACTIGPVKTGTYRIHETHAPDGTTPVGDVGPVVVAYEQTVDVDVKNSVPALHIDLDKSAAEDAVHVGDTIHYTFKATTTGPALTDITLDELNPDVCSAAPSGPVKTGGDQDAWLESGETWTWTCTHVATSDDSDPLPNVAKVTGTDRFGRTVNDTDDEEVPILKPAIAVDKKVDDGDHATSGDALVVHKGDEVTYDVVVTNTGDAPLVLTSLDDTLADLDILCPLVEGTLILPGAHLTCTYTSAIGDDTHNVVTALGTDALEGTAQASDGTFVHPIDPKIQIVKNGPAMVHEGDQVTYTFDVTNTGDATLAPVMVTDDVLGAIGTIPTLGAGQTVQLTKTYTVPQGDGPIHNTAEACGTDELGKDDICDDDDHTTTVAHPDISVDKKVNDGDHATSGAALVVHKGDEVTYDVVVTNTGDVTLTLTVADDSLAALDTLCPDLEGTELEPGASVSCDYDSSIGADAHNVVDVTGEDPIGGEVDASDGTFVHPIDPSVQIVKNGPASAHEGDQITYTFDVTNNGDATLAPVVVTDDVLGTIGTIPSLAAGQTVQLTKTYTVPQGDGPIHNTAEACGTDELGKDDICDDDDHNLTVIHPALSVDKKVNDGDHATSGDALVVHKGDVVDYDIVVHNGGDTLLTLTSAVDSLADLATLCPGLVGTVLDPGEDATCSYEQGVTQDRHNVVTVIGVDPLQSPLQRTDGTFVHPIDPSVQVVKDGPASAHEGDQVTYTFDVTNTGDSTLAPVVVTDDVLGAIGTIPNLAAGQTVQLTKTYTVPEGDGPIHNTAEACGTDELGTDDICDEDDHTLTVIHPSVLVVKDGPALVHEGDQATYTFAVTNTGDTSLAPVVVTDDVIGAIGTIDVLEPGQTVNLDKTTTIGQSDEPIVNTVTACGTDELGKDDICDDDDHTTTVLHPGLEIVKTADTPDGPPRDVTFSYEVTNTGDTTLDGIAVTDDILGDIGVIDSLAPGESQTLTKTQSVDADSPTHNIGTACGTDELDLEVCDTDDEDISVVLGTIIERPTPTLPRTGGDIRNLMLWAALCMLLGATGTTIRYRRAT
jgi:uncharacterized repeat protein (TIGR01451 family)